MGIVYRASPAMLRRPTAIKLLRPDRMSEASLQRFEREVQLTARLTHPNTVAIFDYGRTPEGVFYYAMEYLDGLNLDQLVAEDGPQCPARVVHLLGQVCGSLAEAHGAGLIHRDIKPANILLVERGGVPDVVKVVDFGLAKRVGPDERGETVEVTTANVIQGTPLYVSPEAVRSDPSLDARSDLYAVGAVGYFLLTGAPVFQAKTVVEVLSHHLHTPPEPLSRRAPGRVPEALENLVMRCLAKDAADRPESALSLQRALTGCRCDPPWTADDAAGWWAMRRARTSGESPPPPPTPNDPPTMTVDLDERARQPKSAGARAASAATR
jgi:serine/threonine-protein kinase